MSTPASPAPGVVVRHLDSLAEYERCCELEKLVWAGEDADLVPVTIFVVTKETSGQVLGAFVGGQMIGFTLAMAAFHAAADGGQQTYLHSHMTAVLSEYRDRGVGRMLKLFQRQDAIFRGIALVEWTFDPLEMRNAHFNLMRLGAVVRKYHPNFYGITTSPLHGGMPTDRLVAEWWLKSDRVRRILTGETPRPSPMVKSVRVPRGIDALKKDNPASAETVQFVVREQFEKWLTKDYAVVGFELDDASGTYYLEPYEPPK